MYVELDVQKRVSIGTGLLRFELDVQNINSIGTGILYVELGVPNAVSIGGGLLCVEALFVWLLLAMENNLQSANLSREVRRQ